MQRMVALLGQLLIGGHGHEHVRRLNADLELVKIVILQDLRMLQGAFDQRLRVRLAILFQQMPLERPGVHADPHAAAMVARGFHHLAHPVRAADVTRVDAQACGARLRGLDRAAVVEMNVGDNRHVHLAHDILQRQRTLLIRAGYPDDVDARFLTPPDLRNRRRHIGRERVGHGLHRDRRPAAHRHVAHHDLARRTAFNMLIGTIAAHARLRIGLAAETWSCSGRVARLSGRRCMEWQEAPGRRAPMRWRPGWLGPGRAGAASAARRRRPRA